MHALRKFELSGMKKEAEVRMKQRTHHNYGWRNVNMISRAVSVRKVLLCEFLTRNGTESGSSG